jgi:pimeloyl-ACP methyl ester carboxylesterase
MQENIFQLEDEWLFIRHTGFANNKPVVLFIHGLGESGLCFSEAFQVSALQAYNLVVPDLIGYGRSSRARNGDYAMETQVRRLWRLVDYLQVESFYVVGHSLGGDLGCLMAAADPDRRIKGLVNIEGDLTPQDVFISGKAVAAAERGDFAGWFERDFKEELVLKSWGGKWASCRRYYASLQFCRPEAFLANAREIVLRNQPLPGRSESKMGMTYADLKVPKVFCWGSESLAEGTLDFLEATSLYHKKFTPAFHWPMIDRAGEFYSFLGQFLESVQS